MDRQSLERFLKGVVFARPDGPYIWEIAATPIRMMSTDRYEDILKFRITYYEPDTDTGQPEKQHGRWWYVEDHWSHDDLVKTCWLAITISDEHRRREWFKVNGVAVFNPHQSLFVNLE